MACGMYHVNKCSDVTCLTRDLCVTGIVAMQYSYTALTLRLRYEVQMHIYMYTGLITQCELRCILNPDLSSSPSVWDLGQLAPLI